MVVFGGRVSAPSPLASNATWSLSLAGTPTWSLEAPAGPLPEARSGHTALYDPIRDRMIVLGGPQQFDDGWVLEWGDPRQPGVGCPEETPVVADDGVKLRYAISNPIEQGRAVEWTVTSDAGWPGFPQRGVLHLAAAALETLTVEAPTPPTTEGDSRTVRCAVAFAGATGHEASCAHDLASITTDVLASLVFAEADAERVRLEWRVGAAGPVAIERHEEGRAWTVLGRLLPDPRGTVTWEDRDVEAGRRYAYRLSWTTGAGTTVAGETWVDVPAAYALALNGTRPNPAAGELVVDFTLPRGGDAVLEIFDVTGRRVRPAASWELGAGRHVQRVHGWEELASGLYLVRLRFGGETLHTRVVIAR
jgi:hypothetical protein